jgi:hypothetical protein
VPSRPFGGLGAGNLLDQLAERAADTVQTLTLSQSPSVAPGDDDGIRTLGESAALGRKGCSPRGNT